MISSLHSSSFTSQLKVALIRIGMIIDALVENRCVALKWNTWIFGLVCRKVFYLLLKITNKYKFLVHSPPSLCLKKGWKIRNLTKKWMHSGLYFVLLYFIFGDGSIAEGNKTLFSWFRRRKQLVDLIWFDLIWFDLIWFDKMFCKDFFIKYI